MVPFLFLFFAEAMSGYLTTQDVGLQGLSLPIKYEELLDSEFADDTAMFLGGSEANLMRFQQALECFCQASEAQINWHKSCGPSPNRATKANTLRGIFALPPI